ncbi:MAG: trigger factor, partial [Janthinobacterium sp.]
DGYSLQYEVLNDKVGEAFAQAVSEAKLRVAGQPRITEKEGAPEGEAQFDAVFEVLPEVKIEDLSTAEVDKLSAEVDDAAIDKTIDILRKQRRTFAQRAQDEAAADGDRVTVDFEGKIDGETFAGGKAEDFQFLVGEGQMLKEFEAATLGLKVGESKTFPLSFPEDYHGKDVAGKTASFTITLQKLEWAHLPEVDAEFAKSLGVADGDLAKMREDIKVNLQREVAGRVKARNKEAVMDALIKVAELEVPKTLIAQDSERLAEMTRQDMAQRGMNVKDVPFPAELFAEKAERRVRLGLILSQLVGDNKLQATPEQVKAQIEDFAQSYEDPREVLKYYYSDRRRLGEIEALVLEENVVTYVLGLSKVTTKAVAFDELMGSNAQA